ncbi:MAG: FAD-dependent oxidoreductase, partial [Alicyclobacillaceae bacterium]|nr:FAD-dependent oxidoreductase [Alicyclobacillaceae bacterium]
MGASNPVLEARAGRWQRATNFLWDVIVIGGGITGAGIAREAALAGLSVILLEARDFAFGTSSRSTKMFHGGLRYLQKGEIRLVRESGIERERMLSLSPHLVKPLPFLLPVYRGMRWGLTTMSFAVWLYDVLAKVAPEERRRLLSRSEVLQREPHLSPEGLEGAVLYHEYLTDDARLTVTVVRSAMKEGAEALNRAEVTDLIVDGGRVKGVIVKDGETGQSHAVRGRVVVNAAGPWIEHIVDKD